MSEACDVAIVGAGPAGLACATELRRLGVGRIVVLERFDEAGGMARHCAHPLWGMREFRRFLGGPAYARRLVARALAAGVEIRTGTTVTRIRPHGRLELATRDGAMILDAARVVLATGAREQTRAQRLAPGMRPLGVMNTAALQAFLTLEQRRPFRRPVIIGSELVALSALLSCTRHGIRPAALVETDDRPRSRGIFMALCRLLGVPVLMGATLLSIDGAARVSGLRLLLRDGSERALACDGVVFSGRFTPEAALARDSGLTLDPGTQGPLIDAGWRSSDRHVFAAGNLLHPVETGGRCWAEGRHVARRVAQDLSQGSRQREAVDILLGDGLRYVVPQRIAAGQTPCTLVLRANGALRGRLVLSDGAGRELAVASLRSHPEQSLRLQVPALDRAALSGDLYLRLEGEG
ncbi:FAD-dependent oxidoreductase [Salipiger sp. 1_MG-2023]|uniref:NAD(P)/FAD-dependent oxidoreductase n=1 Tax=Salipiger sp. 1_MG-2023 TaxID=3062665 RepID=UPI0026E1C646|nr:FAD-dependent oxidoreductase [Salipiger sp. 1_MG-2023]MDO6584741.1 FAD-dependent oxidoreductase [Salipiger sp. 1_MG-2023]